jgi:hypothetical protein
MLNVDTFGVERAQRLVDRDHATIETEESARIHTLLDELCDELLFANELNEETTTVHYVPSARAFFSVQDGTVSV